MPWSINGINRNTALGEAIYDYGNICYQDGFIVGCCVGSIVTSIIYLAITKSRL